MTNGIETIKLTSTLTYVRKFIKLEIHPHMRKLLLSFLLVQSIYAQSNSCPEGFTEIINHNTASGGTVNNFQPALNIQACVAGKSGSTGQQVYWAVTGFFHHYKVIKFTKIYVLTCGNTITKEAKIYDLKIGGRRTGSAFGGDIDLADGFFESDCSDKPNRIKSVSINNITCELADDDALVIQENNRLDALNIQNKFDKLVNEGNTLFQQKRYQEAKEKYAEALKFIPGDLNATSLYNNADNLAKSSQNTISNSNTNQPTNQQYNQTNTTNNGQDYVNQTIQYNNTLVQQFQDGANQSWNDLQTQLNSLISNYSNNNYNNAYIKYANESFNRGVEYYNKKDYYRAYLYFQSAIKEFKNANEWESQREPNFWAAMSLYNYVMREKAYLPEVEYFKKTNYTEQCKSISLVKAEIKQIDEYHQYKDVSDNNKQIYGLCLKDLDSLRFTITSHLRKLEANLKLPDLNTLFKSKEDCGNIIIDLILNKGKYKGYDTKVFDAMYSSSNNTLHLFSVYGLGGSYDRFYVFEVHVINFSINQITHYKYNKFFHSVDAINKPSIFFKRKVKKIKENTTTTDTEKWKKEGAIWLNNYSTFFDIYLHLTFYGEADQMLENCVKYLGNKN